MDGWMDGWICVIDVGMDGWMRGIVVVERDLGERGGLGMGVW